MEKGNYFNSYLSNACGTAIFVRKSANIIKFEFSIIDPSNFSTLHFHYDNKRHALNFLYGPNVDSTLYFREVIFESDLNVGVVCCICMLITLKPEKLLKVEW